MTNPFSIAFSIEPANFIDRIREKENILNEFCNDTPSNYTYLLTDN